MEQITNWFYGSNVYGYVYLFVIDHQSNIPKVAGYLETILS